MPKIFAYYLPQFHSFKENDEWWGKGFTEWTNVGKAKPLFKGHDQPRIPTELGYYNLKMPEVREAQAKMAKEAGIDGFLYWHYWFGNGKTLMADIINEVIEAGKPDFPFAIAWANHSWFAKTWRKDTVEGKQLLVEQTYPGEEDIKLFFNSLLVAFKDHRYIKIDGKPLILIFDPVNLPDEYITGLKKLAEQHGFPGLYIIANIVNPQTNQSEFISRGFDAVTYQRLSGATPKMVGKSKWLNRGYKAFRWMKGLILKRPPKMTDYAVAYHDLVTSKEFEENVIPSIVPQWDHTPRSGWNGSLFVNSEPRFFKQHALEAFKTLENKPKEQQIVILKSWNEWGEGNYMEPDMTHGRGFIDALREAKNEFTIHNIEED